ncbi:Eco57I restriction-modification methylase domain-containing protein [Enterococcus sp. 669A]|uniref:Eco57I restriction-modification methylase domain-containing protein n=1 Tax=Candidatus Enterococcus moelleringii TaxID=2815325 RepID=A0ABS3LA21_9ENTE|nr:Eco57I restriction-modification methylase domain-containing protein [Enterococcus sp. 669A]MBO1306477.1 Eco57I restriction-modification methylase domain-containing protein [Enterococcus sp. 669A]
MLHDTAVLDEIIHGYLPHSIYAFETNTHPNYLKVGDTNRSVEVRLNEWRRVYEDLKKIYEASAMLEDKADTLKRKTIFFRDYALHKFLEEDRSKQRLSDNLYEHEFFKNASKNDLIDGTQDIEAEYHRESSEKYNFYKANEHNSQYEQHYKRDKNYLPRPNQEEALKNIEEAVKNGRKNLLLYAVMRFGKSNVAMWAAKRLKSKLTVIVTGKADVLDEWKKTVESHEDFEDFKFFKISEFNEVAVKKSPNKNCVVFTTLQDLAGSLVEVKAKHEYLFSQIVDFLIVDETHFAARAKIYGQTFELAPNEDPDFEIPEVDEANESIENVSKLKSKIQLHLSGTPYRILLSNEFDKEDIVGQIQFSDILAEKQKWIDDNPVTEDKEPWENDYFGFPEMIRFAFTPNKSSLKTLEKLKLEGKSAELNELFRTKSKAKSYARTTNFVHENEVLELLKAIDGSKEDENIFPFLNYDKIKQGNLAQHMVFVLPFKNSTDALERLIRREKESFKNLNTYEILNVASHRSKLTPLDIKNKISDAAKENRKTITLTVNKMLTGSTVPQWDTMVFMKDTSSPQEYDQAIYRLQSPWIKEIKEVNTEKVYGKEDMKPQTLLIDFSPSRMFKIESDRALVVNASKGKSGNDEQEKAIGRNFQYSPIIYINKDKLTQATPTDIIAQIREYAANRSIVDEAKSLLIDYEVLDIPEIFNVISKQPILGGKKGFNIPPNNEEDTDLKVNGGGTSQPNQSNDQDTSDNDSDEENERKDIEKKMQTYYARILLYAFLSATNERNLTEVIESLDKNKRLARHLEIEKDFLELMKEKMNFAVRSTLDNKIENIGDLRSETQSEEITEKLARLGNISANEVITPVWIAQKMVDSLVTKDFIEDYKKQPKRILDMTSKSGVLLICVYRKLKQAGITEEVLKENLFAIATSPMTYEFTRVVFEEFGWNLDHLAGIDKLTSYQIIKDKDSSIEEKLKGVYGDDEMKFDVVIGNPPYQEEGKSRDEPIYHLFMDESYRIADKVLLITPARFLFNAGQTPKQWNRKMLSDEYFKVESFYKKSSEVFPNTVIKGGVAITYRDTDKKFGSVGVFTDYELLNSIIHKVVKLNPDSLSSVVYPTGNYRFSKDFFDIFPQAESMQGKGTKSKIISKSFALMDFAFSTEKQSEDDVRFLGRVDGKREFKWINKKLVSPPEAFENWTVFVPKANQNGIFGEVLTSPLVGEPFVGHTDTFMDIGNFSDEYQANSLLKYLKTKFSRAMLGVLKVTQDNPRGVWKYVPLQDFTESSDIDWSKSIPEIDQQLYAKYGLSEEEINFIETKVKEME